MADYFMNAVLSIDSDSLSMTSTGNDSPSRLISSPSGSSCHSDADVYIQYLNDQVNNSKINTKRPKKRSRFEKNALGHDGGIYYNRQRNGRVIPHIVLPRILKNDIRRQYPTIFRNAMNNCDPVGLYNMFKMLYRPDCIFYNTVPTELTAKTGKESFTYNSTAVFADRFGGFMKFVPDFTMDIGPCTICVRSDGSSMLQFQYRMKGTTFAPPGGHHHAEHHAPHTLPSSVTVNETVFTDPEDASLGTSDDGSGDVELIQSFSDGFSVSEDMSSDEIVTVSSILREAEKSTSTMMPCLQPVQEPLVMHSFLMDGVGTMHLDETNLISTMQMTMKDYIKSYSL